MAKYASPGGHSPAVIASHPGCAYLVRRARVGAGVHQPPDHVRMTGNGGVMQSGLMVRVERVQAHVVDGV